MKSITSLSNSLFLKHASNQICFKLLNIDFFTSDNSVVKTEIRIVEGRQVFCLVLLIYYWIKSRNIY